MQFSNKIEFDALVNSANAAEQRAAQEITPAYWYFLEALQAFFPSAALVYSLGDWSGKISIIEKDGFEVWTAVYDAKRPEKATIRPMIHRPGEDAAKWRDISQNGGVAKIEMAKHWKKITKATQGDILRLLNAWVEQYPIDANCRAERLAVWHATFAQIGATPGLDPLTMRASFAGVEYVAEYIGMGVYTDRTAMRYRPDNMTAAELFEALKKLY